MVTQDCIKNITATPINTNFQFCFITLSFFYIHFLFSFDNKLYGFVLIHCKSVKLGFCRDLTKLCHFCILPDGEVFMCLQVSHRKRQSLPLIEAIADVSCYVRSIHNSNHPMRMVMRTPTLRICGSTKQCHHNYQYSCFPFFCCTHSFLYIISLYIYIPRTFS